MPIGAINWNNATKTLCLRGAGPKRGSSPYFSFRKVANDIFVDDSPTVNESTRPWTVTHVNEINIGKLTGNPAAKKAKLIQWAQQYLFDTIVLLTDLAVDDADRIADPDNSQMFWCDEDGTKNASGLYVNSRSVILVDFDETALASDELVATLRTA